jgi:hypothetical protein
LQKRILNARGRDAGTLPSRSIAKDLLERGIIGLPAGIWALVVLGRPEVMAAFIDKRRGTTPGAPGAPEPTGPVAAKFRSWLGSFVKYVVSIPGLRGRRRSANERLENDE